jgi:glycosyltransferase involved in cell wall biosynthesis
VDAGLKISILISTAGARYGGLETCAHGFARGLQSRGHRVSLITGWSRKASFRSDYDCVHVPCPQIAHVGAWRALRPAWLPMAMQAQLFVASTHIHAVARHTIESSDVTMTFLEPETVSFSSHLKSKMIPNVSYFSGGISWLWFRQDQSAVRVSISRTLADFVAKEHEIKCDGVVAPGVSTEWLNAPAPPVRMPPSSLVYSGRLEENKGIMLLVAIIDDLRKQFPNLQIRFLGSGPLKARLGDHPGLRVEGSYPRVQIAQALAQSDVFVFPSHYESFGLAPLEAQAVGIPVVASDLPALHEALDGAALFAPARDKPAWIETLNTLLSDAKQRKALAHAGRVRARRATWDIAAMQLERYLLLAVANPQRRPGDPFPSGEVLKEISLPN